MSLRSVKNITRIPKTRKRTIDVLKNVTPTRKGKGIEYRFKIYFKYDKFLNKQFYAISILTEKIFVVLNYSIVTEVKKSKEVIDISLNGLTTKQSYFVTPKPASTELLFEDLYGDYTINILKQDGSINVAIIHFNIFKKEILLVSQSLPQKKNNRKFCTFEIDFNSFSFKD